jgi:hypothetical protein
MHVISDFCVNLTTMISCLGLLGLGDEFRDSPNTDDSPRENAWNYQYVNTSGADTFWPTPPWNGNEY